MKEKENRMHYFDIDIWKVIDESGSFFQISDELQEIAVRLNLIREELSGMSGMEEVSRVLSEKSRSVYYQAGNMEEYGFWGKRIVQQYLDAEENLVRAAGNESRTYLQHAVSAMRFSRRAAPLLREVTETYYE